jgi:hypothetical protein
MIKTLLWESANNWEPFIDALSRRGILDCDIWVGRNPKCTYDVHEFDYMRLQNYKFSGLGTLLVEKLQRHFVTFCDMYSRNYDPAMQNRYNGLTIHEMQNAFAILIDFFAQLLINREIELVIISRIPHLGADFLMLEVARALDIKTLTFQQSLFPNKFFYVQSADELGRFHNKPLLENPQEIELECTHEYNWPYMEDKPNTESSSSRPRQWLKGLRQWLKRASSKHKLDRDELLYEMYYSGHQQSFEQNLNQSDRKPDLEANYVYFPLHLQPEMTTSALGRKYSDQLLALERLSSMLPPGWLIYAKENPKQTSFQRGPFFYKRLAGLKNVRYVHKSVSTVDLIKHSQLVATITGTAGWEAITGGKNALVFGRAWYRELPGVFEYQENLKISDVVTSEFTHKALEKEVSMMLATMGTGIIYGVRSFPPTLIENFDFDHNVDLVTSSLTQIIELVS